MNAVADDLGLWRVIAALVLCLILAPLGALALRARLIGSRSVFDGKIRFDIQSIWQKFAGFSTANSLIPIKVLQVIKPSPNIEFCVIKYNELEYMIIVTPHRTELISRMGIWFWLTMMKNNHNPIARFVFGPVLAILGFFATSANAASVSTTPLLTDTSSTGVVQIVLVLTLLSIIPGIIICMTPFLRIAIALSMIRHAFGMPETPPNQVLVSVALILTLLVMGPAIAEVNKEALQPFLSGKLPVSEAITRGSAPLKAFMLRQVHDQDLKTVYEISRKVLPDKASDVGLMELTTAFILNELRVSFKMGFIILLPFLLIDLVVSSVLLALGMLMVPPSTLALPLKVLMFVLIDGWSLVLNGVVSSFR